MEYLALDIGGATLKVANGLGFAAAEHFDLREHPGSLMQELRTLIAGAPQSDHLLVTMTGELSKCFTTREEGVRFIVEALLKKLILHLIVQIILQPKQKSKK